MASVSDSIQEVCPKAAAHISKKLNHAELFLTRSPRRKALLVENFGAKL